MQPFSSAVLPAIRILRTHPCLIAAGAALVFSAIAAPLRADDYATIAGAVASPLPNNRDALKKAYTDGQVMLRVELARQRLQSASSVASDLAAPRRNVFQHLDSCNGSMQEIRRLDSTTPDIEAIVNKAFIASPALLRRDSETGNLVEEDRQAVGELASTLIVEGIKSIADAWNASNERDNYRDRYRLAREEALALANVAQKRCKGRSPTFYGVGIAVDLTDDAILVAEALADGPAAKAGLRKGDELLAVNGDKIKKTEGNRTVIDRNAFRALRGDSDTPVKLTYSRGGVSKTVELRRSFPAKSPLLDIDFDGSWYATFSQDCLDLRNISGGKLTNCTLLVTLEGTHGESDKLVQRQHLHYVDHWPADEWRYAWYRSSTADGIAADESLDRVQRVVIDLYSDQYRDTITYEYAGTSAFGEDIDRYIDLVKKQQKFTMNFVSDNIFTSAGVVLQHEGSFKFIPDPAMTVTLTRGRDVRKMTWRATGKPWNAGYLSGSSLKDPSFNGINPERVDIDLEFPGSSKKTSFRWDFPKR